MQHSLSKSVMADSHQAHLPNELPLRKEGTARRSRSNSKPVICEFRRTTGLMPQLSKYMKPAGRNVVIRFVQDDDLERPRR
jgi:hypothetical protein